MNRKRMFVLFLLSTLLLFTACSSTSNDSSKEAWDENSNTESSNYFSADNSNDNESVDYDEDSDAEFGGSDTRDSVESDHITRDRMIIHQAHLYVNVKDLENAQLKIEEKVSKYGGYVVESSVYRENEEHAAGNIIVRIPAKHFQNFLSDSEDIAAEVLERNVTGQDVTEQYVDLESRVKSKRAVEERLLEFMKEAKKTEDLLKISSDLATVQEDIEVIVGKMKYLENQTSFSTIEISMNENRVIIPELESKDLDTWEKTKKQLAKSINFILATASGLIVFLIGNLPVIIILFVIGLGIYFFAKRKTQEFNDRDDQ